MHIIRLQASAVRRDRAQDIIAVYARALNGTAENSDERETLTDLLADLFHYFGKHVMQEEFRIARNHFVVETEADDE